MAGDKILVLGGTGPAGICLLRELLFRGHATIAFCRNVAKVPDDLKDNKLLEIVEGQLTDIDALGAAVAKSSQVISLLGPNSISLSSHTLFADFYRALFPLMRQHAVRRILIMGTISISLPTDTSSMGRGLAVMLVKTVAKDAYRNIIAIQDLLEKDAEATRDIDWIVFRIAMIPGGSDAASWERDRRDGEAYVGSVGAEGWTMSQKRGALTRWLVDAAEEKGVKFDDLAGKMPAVCRLKGSVERSD